MQHQGEARGEEEEKGIQHRNKGVRQSGLRRTWVFGEAV